MTDPNRTNQTPLSRRTFLQRLGGFAATLLLSRCATADRAEPETATDTVASSSTAAASPTPVLTPTRTPSPAPTLASNTIGTGRGVHPGRVVWAHDPLVTRWSGRGGPWWTEEALDPGGVAEMLSQSLRALTEVDDDAAAWNQLFAYSNSTRGRGDSGYSPGQKIAIKLNLNVVSTRAYNGLGAFSAPPLVAALVSQLVQNAGVPASAITLYDATRVIPEAITERCEVPEFEGLRFVDWAGGAGREQYRRDPNALVTWSGDVQGNPTYLPTCVTEADYLINLASLRGHTLAGITLCGKNHFGTICADLDGAPTRMAPQGADIHGTVAAHDFGGTDPAWTWSQRPMGSYNAIVDLMAHPHLGGKTLLHMLDGFYVAQDQNSSVKPDCRWESSPFNGHWTSSLFLSQDEVAIDSVGLDFIRNEPSLLRLHNVMPPNSTCENYLHEAALIGDPPSGITYDSDASGLTVTSLGVHDHWDGADTRRYGRNLGASEGIELVAVR